MRKGMTLPCPECGYANTGHVAYHVCYFCDRCNYSFQLSCAKATPVPVSAPLMRKSLLRDLTCFSTTGAKTPGVVVNLSRCV